MFDSVKIAEEFCFNYDFRQGYVQQNVFFQLREIIETKHFTQSSSSILREFEFLCEIKVKFKSFISYEPRVTYSIY